MESISVYLYIYICIFLLQDQFLQDRIDREIRIRDGTAKLLAAAKHPQQMLEAAKNMLTTNVRIMSYMSELQKSKTEQVLNKRRWVRAGKWGDVLINWYGRIEQY